MSMKPVTVWPPPAAQSANFLTRIRNAAQLVCVCGKHEKMKVGAAMQDVAIIEFVISIFAFSSFTLDFFFSQEWISRD